MNINKVKIGKSEFRKLVLIAGGNFTADIGGSITLDRSKLDIGGLDIVKDGREYWCDTSVSLVEYDSQRDVTTVQLDLVNDPDSMPVGKQDLTEDDLYSKPEFYLWTECDRDLNPSLSMVTMSGAVMRVLDLNEGGEQ